MDAPKRHLIIDGHNVLHAWQWIGSRTTEPWPVSGAREQLVQALRVAADVLSMDVTIVFDGRGDVSHVDPGPAMDGFSVVYASAGLTADGVIERMVAAERPAGRCVVATADAAIRGNVLAAGGESISPEELKSWIERSQIRAQRAIRTRSAAQQKNFGNKLSW